MNRGARAGLIRMVLAWGAAGAPTPMLQGRPGAAVDPPAPGVSPAAASVHIAPEVVIRDLRSLHRERTVDQSFTLVARGAGGDTRRAEGRIRTEPSGDLRLELGDLTVWTFGGTLRAVHARDAEHYAEFDLGTRDRAAAVFDALPPLPLPQIAIAAGSDDRLAAPTPYTRGVTWSPGELSLSPPPARVVMSGRAEASTIRLTIDAEGGWLREAVIEAEEGSVRLEVSFDPPDAARASDPTRTPPSIEHRKRVLRLGDLNRSEAPAPADQPTSR